MAFTPTLVNKINIPVDKIIATKTQNVTASSASLTIDLSKGEYIILTLSATVTSLTIQNWPVNYEGKLTLEIRNQGAYNITGWSGAKWSGGAPTITSGAGNYDLVALVSADSGTTIYGNVIGQNYS